MSLREAAQQALEALEMWVEGPFDSSTRKGAQTRTSVAITALRTALSEPEQEPVAWSTRERFYEALDRAVENVRQEMLIKTVTMRYKNFDIALPVIDAYGGHVLVGQVSHPPQRKPLTDEEILSDEVLRYHFGCNGGAGPVSQKGIKIVRAVERAHGIGGEA